MDKLGLEKAEESEITLPTFTGSWRKLENSRKTSASLTMLKPLAVQVNNKVWKILKEMVMPDHITCPRNLYAGQEAIVRTRHGAMDWFQLGKEYVKTIYCHLAYLIYMQSTS